MLVRELAELRAMEVRRTLVERFRLGADDSLEFVDALFPLLERRLGLCCSLLCARASHVPSQRVNLEEGALDTVESRDAPSWSFSSFGMGL